MSAHAERIGNMKALYSPDMQRVAERLESGERFTEQEQAESAQALAQDPRPRQQPLPLRAA